MSEQKSSHGKVLQTITESGDTTSLLVDPSEPEKFRDRKPGQFATIRVMQDGGWSDPHPFTISCAPEDEALRFTIKAAGDFTAKVPGIKPGTPIQCAGPFGHFCGDIESRANIVMIAGGVGVTPFLSVLRHFRNIKAKNKVTLLWANKTEADIFDGDELAAMTAELDLIVVHVLSRAAAAPSSPAPRVLYELGRLGRETILRHAPDPGAAAFYLCGPPAMQEAVLAALRSCGVDPDSVAREKFTT